MSDSLLENVRLASGFRGLFGVLNGFFDATGSHEDPKFAGVAGYLFDATGLQNFRVGLDEIKVRLLTEFGISFDTLHATHCCGSRGYYEFQNWPKPARLRLCKDMATLAGQTRFAGFAVFAEHSLFDELKAESPHTAKKVGDGLYPAMLMHCIEHVAGFAKANNETIFYWLEQGDPQQAAATDILTRISLSEHLSERYRYFSHAVVPKGHSEAVALMAADQLAWECKRNFAVLRQASMRGAFHPEDGLSDNFKLLRGDSQQRWIERHMVKGSLDVRALINMFYRLT